MTPERRVDVGEDTEALMGNEGEIEIAKEAMEDACGVDNLEESANKDGTGEENETGLQESDEINDVVEDPNGEDEVIGPVAETKETIKDALIDALNDPQAAEMLASKIAIKLNQKESDAEVTESYWIRGEDYVSCAYCTKYSGSEQVPAALRKYRKGNFGRIMIESQQFHIRRSQKTPESNDLHK